MVRLQAQEATAATKTAPSVPQSILPHQMQRPLRPHLLRSRAESAEKIINRYNKARGLARGRVSHAAIDGRST